MNSSKEKEQALDKTIKDQAKQIEELKETVYEKESDYVHLENASEDLKNQLNAELSQKSKENRKIQDLNAELQKKLDSQHKKYESEYLVNKDKQEADLKASKDRVVELEKSQQEKDEAFEIAQQKW